MRHFAPLDSTAGFRWPTRAVQPAHGWCQQPAEQSVRPIEMLGEDTPTYDDAVDLARE